MLLKKIKQLRDCLVAVADDIEPVEKGFQTLRLSLPFPDRQAVPAGWLESLRTYCRPGQLVLLAYQQPDPQRPRVELTSFGYDAGSGAVVLDALSATELPAAAAKPKAKQAG
jgi:hypothetical protein